MTGTPLSAADRVILDNVKKARPSLWCNPAYAPARDDDAQAGLQEAVANWQMLAPLLKALFPELEATNGTIASELIEVDGLRAPLDYQDPAFGRLFVKADHALPVAGSVKARGGIFEVLMTAVNEARASGFLSPTDPITELTSDAAHAFFSERTIAVGSTGNLGLSVGIAARTLGYNAVVHMSSDAKKWKIDRLRRFGVKVKQHRGDYNLAVAAARDAARKDPMVYFVDDEDSELLFTGYSASALELASQLIEAGINIGPDRPLFLYLPCGIGGAPGGIAYGARGVFGANVHCFFAEPVQSPSALLQMMHGPHSPRSVYEFDLTNKTEADGMAVATMSHLVARQMADRLAGVYTVGDDDLMRFVALAYGEANLKLEPSATIGFAGPHFMLETREGQAFCDRHLSAKAMENAIHVVWTTGGSFVPELQFQTFVDKGNALPLPLDLKKEQ
ncbi:D-serine ammonia-lyase [uncultured Cohaesibacter sp.]|uniref:D-serine ammonia-lyase n=1 Tax=uncultured Cohaesibacter sp. TaxID=1002546 RepID=UPI0029C95375|nr:D-serine ammonia-lyase [uncultured Cohaesibacter sp.]